MRSLLAIALLLVTTSVVGAQAGGPRADALAAEQAHDLVRAQQAWQQVLASEPQDAEAYAHLGLVYALQGNYTDAIPAYRHALAERPGFPGVAMNLGLAYFKSAQLQQAISALQAAAREQPSDPRPGLLLGMAHYGLGDYAAAIPYLRTGVIADPTNLALRLTLAQSCLWAKDYGCALEQDELILRQNPDSAQADMITGEALDAKSDTLGAITQFRAAEAVAPGTPNLHFGLGYLLWKSGDAAGADAEFTKELALDPHHTQALTYAGDLAIKANDWKAAREKLEGAAAQPNTVSLTWLDLGKVNAHDRRNDEARANYKRAIALDPGAPDAHYRLARLDKEMGNTAEADAELAIVQKLHKVKDNPLADQLTPAKSTQP